MKQVFIHVEGPSDKLALDTVLRRIIEQKQDERVFIEVIEVGGGDRKVRLLETLPGKLADKICSDPNYYAVIMPDLYPPNKGFPHTTFQELQEGIMARYHKRLAQKGINNDILWDERMKVFCFKYDMEALLLAAREDMLRYLKLEQPRAVWAAYVEDQNFDNPPKKIVGKLFEEAGLKYIETSDAVDILRGVDLQTLTSRLPQQFAPLVNYLRNL